jgi:hypothetical protein
MTGMRERRIRRRQTYTRGMAFSASEFYEAGMSLPPEVRKDVALRLLETVDQGEAFAAVAEGWLRTEAAAAYDALKAEPSSAIPAEDVRAGFEAKWAARS